MRLQDIFNSPSFRVITEHSGGKKGSTSCAGDFWHGLVHTVRAKGRWIAPGLRGKGKEKQVESDTSPTIL